MIDLDELSKQSVLMGLMSWYLAVIFFTWGVAAIIRAIKTAPLLRWPINGRWILGMLKLCFFFTFVEAAYNRLIIGFVPLSNNFAVFSRLMLVIFATWGLWRWLCGNLLELRDIRHDQQSDK